MATEFKLPELSEGIDSGDVLEVYVSEGDTVSINQPVLELETDKATVEVPSKVAGTVVKVHVAKGQSVAVGAVVLTVEAGASPAAQPAAPFSETRQWSSRHPLPETPEASSAGSRAARQALPG